LQFHHAAYSNGVHGTLPNHEHADNRSGVEMRAYTPMVEEYGVAADGLRGEQLYRTPDGDWEPIWTCDAAAAGRSDCGAPDARRVRGVIPRNAGATGGVRRWALPTSASERTVDEAA